MSSIPFNPMPTTGVANGFVLSSDGFVQGVVQDDPGLRYQIEAGQVSASQTTPLWGGLPVQLIVPAADTSNGPAVLAATAFANMTGFVVFNGASAGIISPASPVPLYTSGMSANFVRIGSGLRVPLPVNPAVVSSLVGADSNVALYWDFTNNWLTNAPTTGDSTALPFSLVKISATSEVVSYSSTTGAATWAAGDVALVKI